MLGGIAVSLLTAPMAHAAATTAKADALYPYLKMYLEAPPEQRTHFVLAYYAMRGHKPAPDVKAFLLGANGARRPIAIAGDGRVQTLPSLAELHANIQVEFDAAPNDKITPNLEILATMAPAQRLDTHALEQAMQQANAAIAAHAGVLAFAAPKLTCAYMIGAHSGQAVLANGRSVVNVRVRAIAEGGEANRAVIELLAKALGVPKGKIRVLSGATSRLKQIAVDGDPTKLGETLLKLMAGKPDELTDKGSR